jgi:hypothetical protein
VTTPKMPPLPVGPTPREAWFVRAAYVGTIVFTLTAMVGMVLGGHAYQWEMYTWGGLTLFWVFMWSYQVSASLSWRAAFQEADARTWHAPRVILLDDKPEGIPKE